MENRKDAEIHSAIAAEYIASVDSRLASPESYIEYQIQEARRAMPFLSRYLSFRGASVLEVGGGMGGQGIAYACEGMRVVSLDIDQPALEHAARAARQRGAPVSILAADGTALPFPSDWFDAVLLDSVIEHVHDPGMLLLECGRVLKRGGIVFVVFPPFYGPLSGHIDDFCLIPWFHLLPKRIVENTLLNSGETKGFLTPNAAVQVYASLNHMTVRLFRKLTRRAGLRIEYIRVRPFLTHPGTRLIVGLAQSVRRPPRLLQMREAVGRARKEFNLRTGALFVLLSALGPLAFVPGLQDMVAGGCKAVLRKV